MYHDFKKFNKVNFEENKYTKTYIVNKFYNI